MYFEIDPHGDTLITFRDANSHPSFLSTAGTVLPIEVTHIKKIRQAAESDPVSNA